MFSALIEIEGFQSFDSGYFLNIFPTLNKNSSQLERNQFQVTLEPNEPHYSFTTRLRVIQQFAIKLLLLQWVICNRIVLTH